MLRVRGFLSANEKVRQVEFHPTQPWVISATKADQVLVWDWSTQQVLCDFQLGASDDDVVLDTMLSRASEGSGFASNASAILPALTKTAPGKVKDVKFLDMDVAQAWLHQQHYALHGSSTPPPTPSKMTALSGVRLLIIVCENKTLIHDMMSKSTYEVGKNMTENKTMNCVSFVFAEGTLTSPLLALGCSDSTVRLVQLFPIRMAARCVCTNKNAVLMMTTVMGSGDCSDLLVAGHQGGSLTLWKLSSSACTTGADINPCAAPKGHGSDVVAMCLVPGMDGFPQTRRLLYTGGLDNKICFWDLGSMAEVAPRLKLDKHNLTCMALCPLGFRSAGTHNLLYGTEDGILGAISTSSNAIQPLFNLADAIPSGQKKLPKVYGLACHPLQPRLVLAATNVGSVLLTYDQRLAMPLAPAEPAFHHQDHVVPDLGSGLGISYITCTEGVIEMQTCSAGEMKPESSRPLPPVQLVGARVKLGNAKYQGPAKVVVSPGSEYVAVVWPQSLSYQLFKQATLQWSELPADGHAMDVAWQANTNKPNSQGWRRTFAVVVRPPAAAPQLPTTKKSGFFGGKKAVDVSALKVALEAAGAAADTLTHVMLRNAEGSSQAVKLDAADAGVPIAVHGGPLLGVVFRREAPPSDLSPGDSPNLLQFFSWDTRKKVGIDLPEPACLAWDSSLTYCALVYSSQVVICHTVPQFHCVASVALKGVSSIRWSKRHFFVVNTSGVYAVFVCAKGASASSGATTKTHVLTIASADAVSREVSSPSASLPEPLPRPLGPLIILGPMDSNLWVANSQGQPIALPLTHPGLRCRFLTALGNVAAARQVAEAHLPATARDDIATFMVDMDNAPETALTLTGISLHLEARLRIQLFQWDAALACCSALLEGKKERPALPDSDDVDGAPKQRHVPPSGLFMPDLDFGRKYNRSAVDWLQPLKDLRSTKRSMSTRPATDAPPAAITLTLQLLDAMTSTSAEDTTRQAAMLLLPYVQQMDADQLAKLARCMAQAGLRREFDDITRVVMLGSERVDKDAAGALGALLSGHGGVVSAVLQQGGAAALASMHASTYRLTTASSATAAWKEQLKSVAEKSTSVVDDFVFHSVLFTSAV